MSGLHKTQSSISPSSVSCRGNARPNAPDLAQLDLLPIPYASYSFRDQSRTIFPPCSRSTGELDDAGDASMTDTPPYGLVTLLGHRVTQPARPDAAILERV